jgi:hypothetical protein
LEHNKNNLSEIVGPLNQDKIAETINQPDMAEIGMQITDVVVSSGLLEQFGTELGVSGAVVAAIIGMYWKYRGKESQALDEPSNNNDKEISEITNEASEEVEKLKNIEEK